MKHTHPEIVHRDARRLLALELVDWRNWQRKEVEPFRTQNEILYANYYYGLIFMARRFDLYLRTGAGKEF